MKSPVPSVNNPESKVRSPFEKLLCHDNPEPLSQDAENNDSDGLVKSSPQGVVDLTSARKEINATSGALLETLQAARRRKLLVSRTQDSSAVKDEVREDDSTPLGSPLPSFPEPPKRHTTKPISPRLGHKRRDKKVRCSMKSIRPSQSKGLQVGGAPAGIERTTKIAKKAVPLLPTRKQSYITPKKLPPEEDPYKPFKALPLPYTTIAGGSAGVPKVSKPPPTKPSSPRLGLKSSGIHSSGKRLKSYTKPLRKIASEVIKPPPKSLPVQKKAALNAKPFKRIPAGIEASREKERLLREKIEKEKVERRRKSVFRARPLPSYVCETANGGSSPPLKGVEFLHDDVTSPITLESFAVSPATRNSISFAAPELHTRTRSKKRGEFEERRLTREHVRQVEKRKARKSMMQEKKKDLVELREHLK
eukprot:CAMPEP_0172520362 /NCGR_PEP_ID=MMETSP1066-20121228/291949_1 /TAXON_ID=671091 /ORGANISM="Coscinodiscus wailesii, Strain CCMP2513" /LENGTH=419 /DNA_ID=CAMNT_0013303105 /DNA_START=1355 /DNA_END=2614 /DNA_ORIENTATION=+